MEDGTSTKGITLHGSTALAAQTPSTPTQNPARVYLASLAQGSRATMACALHKIAAVLGFTIDSCPWPALRFAHTTALRTWLLERYRPATCNRFLAALRGVLKAALRLELVRDDDYRRAVDVPPVRGSTVVTGRALVMAELRALFLACHDSIGAMRARDAAIVAVLYAGGLRRDELRRLRVECLDGNALVVDGKGQKQRKVYLAEGAMQALTAWLAVRGREPGPLMLACSMHGNIVEPFRGLTGESIRRLLLTLADRAELDKFTPHDMRRTFIGDLLDAGVDLRTVQELVGHANPLTTARYDRRPERARAAAAGKLAVPYVP